MKNPVMILIAYCATVIGFGLGLVGYGKIKSYTYVPEPPRMSWNAPAAFNSVAFCFDCKYEPWQRIIVGEDLKANPPRWTVHDISVEIGGDGLTGDIGCNASASQRIQ